MENERTCENCKYSEKSASQEPCNTYSEICVLQWEPKEYTPNELALRFIERLENDTNRRQWCADMKEQGKCNTECINCIMAAVKKLLES